MTFEEVMEEIQKGLTGETEADIQYLQQKATEYEKYEFGESIAGECGRMIYERLPEELKDEFVELSYENRLGIAECNEKAKVLIEKGKLDEAIELLENMINTFTESGMYKDKDVEYYDFRQPIEEVFFRELYGMDKKIRIVPEPVSGLYRAYGSALYEKGEYEAALEALTESMRWSPYKISAAIEYSHCLRALGRMEEYKASVLNTFRSAYSAKAVAACYRCLGYYYAEKKEWEAAAVCEKLSKKYDPDDNVACEELKYIKMNLPDDFIMPEGEDLKAVASKYDFPPGPDEYIIEVAKSAGEQFEASNNADVAEYFYNIVNDLMLKK